MQHRGGSSLIYVLLLLLLIHQATQNVLSVFSGTRKSGARFGWAVIAGCAIKKPREHRRLARRAARLLPRPSRSPRRVAPRACHPCHQLALQLHARISGNPFGRRSEPCLPVNFHNTSKGGVECLATCRSIRSTRSHACAACSPLQQWTGGPGVPHTNNTHGYFSNNCTRQSHGVIIDGVFAWLSSLVSYRTWQTDRVFDERVRYIWVDMCVSNKCSFERYALRALSLWTQPWKLRMPPNSFRYPCSHTS